MAVRVGHIYDPRFWPTDPRHALPKWAHRHGDSTHNELGWHFVTATPVGLALFGSYQGMKGDVRTVYYKDMGDYLFVVNSYRRIQTVYAVPRDDAARYLQMPGREAGSAEILEVALNIAVREKAIIYTSAAPDEEPPTAPVAVPDEERWNQVHERDFC